jgi:hypothetical protein
VPSTICIFFVCLLISNSPNLFDLKKTERNFEIITINSELIGRSLGEGEIVNVVLNLSEENSMCGS